MYKVSPVHAGFGKQEEELADEVYAVRQKVLHKRTFLYLVSGYRLWDCS